MDALQSRADRGQSGSDRRISIGKLRSITRYATSELLESGRLIDTDLPKRTLAGTCPR
jgi:hypothetical protein